MKSNSSALGRIKIGSLFLELSSILFIVSIIVVLYTAFNTVAKYINTSNGVSGLNQSQLQQELLKQLNTPLIHAIPIIVTVIAIIGSILILTGYLNEKIKTNYSDLGKVGTIIMIIGAVVYALPVNLFGDIIFVIGQIILGISFYRTGETFNEGSLKNAGILVALPFLITQVIGYALSYIGVNKVIRELNSAKKTVKVSSLGSGIIRGNGILTISLYSDSDVYITQAQIVGTNYISTSITPNYLKHGFNNITIDFNNLSLNLIPNSLYTVRLLLANGDSIDIQVTAQP
ncbi:DUF973 family protein [Sulfolobus acidocaldarius]|uniref:Conserved protein n=5 Tax=Sulfolobus acidocaldarius TaxID=2285 RepID=Q4J9W3_SULAC|nr:DUF973 family protein [Sulfolobus acidocaldarius]AAY80417.1 conserved protein [Sulfolobus acidocaldarius DSM 639]AGE71000.1 hypothetical protein SacN8_05145 [Sulfolobus acidocaldarius N8]AGE73271.1 hypothetical protein SacRon12I_05135 [Sulfolobus acidocaldarius Ron12/I]ALU28702.1 hypothetical protein ATY89_01170 [Sulfolobus acidocaldarius]ALU31420.1 hypothetical protein ATZ20_04205 [Sulfolobus acidocaldarius]